jgi:hypothetical protein
VVPNSLEEAERFQNLFVKPMVEAMEAKIEAQFTPIAASQARVESVVNGFESRIHRLEADQRKALWGWGAYCVAASTLLGIGLNWVKQKLWPK